jgi:hypothetical protein
MKGKEMHMLYRSGARGSRLVPVLVAGLMLTAAVIPGAAQASEPNSNFINDIPPFPRDLDSGSMAIHALRASLRAYDLQVSYNRVAGFSGTVFKVVYDTVEAYEPLRDLSPVDCLGEACNALGFPDAGWETGLSMAEVKNLVKAEIDAGHPVLASFLMPEAYHGFVIITGYDYEKGAFLVQGAFEGAPGYRSVAVPESWSGPTLSPLGWADNPVFVMGKHGGQLARHILPLELSDLEIASGLFAGGELPYGGHPGESEFMARPGGRTAIYGLPAYDLLATDLEETPLVTYRNGHKALNFGLIWRIDAMVGQLQHDRLNGSMFLSHMAGALPEDRLWVLESLVAEMEKTAFDAYRLRGLFWSAAAESLDSKEEVLEVVSSSESMVFRIPEGLVIESKQEAEYFMAPSPWGPVLIDDSPAKRLEARMLVQGIKARDAANARLVERVIEEIESKKETGKPRRGGGRRGWKSR